MPSSVATAVALSEAVNDTFSAALAPASNEPRASPGDMDASNAMTGATIAASRSSAVAGKIQRVT